MTDQSSLLSTTEQPNTDVTSAPAPTSAPAAPVSEYDTLLQGIKTEDGRQKYATASDAINSIPHKEQHIATLESENAALRDATNELKAKLEGVESLIEELRNNNTAQVMNQTDQPQQGIDINELTSGVITQLKTQEAAQKQALEISAFKASMAEKFGSKADEMLVATAKEKGYSLATLEMVVKNDGAKAAIGMLGLTDVKQADTGSVPTSKINATSEPSDPQAYYKKPSKPKAGSQFAALRDELSKQWEREGKI